MKIKAPRGTVDILPDEIENYKYVQRVAAETARVFGFSEISTPVFEHTELFERGVGDTTDVVQKEMYTFPDKSERSITLRPEGTASVARAYLEHSLYALPAPVKLFYDITCYRYEKPQTGRLREFHQFGAEVFGTAEPSIDAEIIAFVNSIFKNIGIKNLVLNINSIGCPSCRKEFNAALTEYLKSNYDSLCTTCHGRLERNPMRVLDCKNKSCKQIAEGAPAILDFICTDCRSHFEEVQKLLNAVGISYNIDPSIVRGLDYYTRTVFEFVSTEIGAQGTVCGGGRYDNLIELLGGGEIPGIGFAMGIERIILVMKAQGIVPKVSKRPDVYIASAGEGGAVLSLVCGLRDAGVYAECDHAGRSLKAQMKNAGRMGARFSMVIGGDEVVAGKANIKNMDDGTVAQTGLDILSIKNNLSQGTKEDE